MSVECTEERGAEERRRSNRSVRGKGGLQQAFPAESRVSPMFSTFKSTI
jgi:hypothetical protein